MSRSRQTSFDRSPPLYRQRGGFDLTAPGYPGEHHAPGYNYLGPGTHVQERLARGDRPVNDLDACAKAHDTSYLNASMQFKRDGNRPAALGRVHEADVLFRDCASKSKDAPLLGSLASKAIAAKQVGEDTGVISTKLFSGVGRRTGGRGASVPVSAVAMHKKSECKGGCGCDGCIHAPMPPGVRIKQVGIMQGGLAPLLIGVISALAGTALDKLYDHFFADKGSGNVYRGMGYGIAKSDDKKRDELLSLISSELS